MNAPAYYTSEAERQASGCSLPPCTRMLFLAVAMCGCTGRPPEPDADDRTYYVHRHPAIIEGERATLWHAFTLTNPNPTDMVVAEIGRSCSCATATCTPRVLRPGQSGTLTMEADLEGRTGFFGTEVVVRHSVGEPLRYRLEALVYPLAEFAPPAIPLRMVPASSPVTTEFVLREHSRSGRPHRTAQVQGAVGCSDVQITRVRSDVAKLADGVFRRSTTYKLSFVADHSTGPGELRIAAATSTGSAAGRHLRVTWQTASPFKVDPPRVLFLRSGHADAVTKHVVRLRHVNAVPFRIVRAVSDVSAVEVRHDARHAERTQHDLVVELIPSRMSSRDHGHISVECALDDDRVVLDIPLFASL